MSNWRNPQTTFIEYKIVKKSGISGDDMNGFVTKWLGGGRTKMVEIEVKGQMITHDFFAPDRMSSSYPKTLVPIWEIWWRDAMGPFQPREFPRSGSKEKDVQERKKEEKKTESW